MQTPATPSEGDFGRRLFHRWFVEYNPLYLLSAALVLAGLTVISRETARSDSLMGALGVAAVSELYALTLIGGAALLTRIGLRRPAVMLALIAVLYQCDITLHLETCAYLGVVGRVAAAAWLVFFVLKLYALAAALELRPSRSALVVPVLGAAGMALLPHVFREFDPMARTELVALWAFGVGAAGLWTSREVESAVGFDVRGRRAMRATWILWAALALGHVLYWSVENEVRLTALAPVAIILATRWMRREASVWVIALTALAGSAVLAPASLSSTALMVAIVLALRAWRAPVLPAACAAPRQPYRDVVAPPPAHGGDLVLRPSEPAAALRLLVGAAWSTHLATWTLGWAGGAWPEHRIVLDVVLALVCALALWRSRRALPSAPVLATALHLAIANEWIGAPRGALQWGIASIVLGFTLLLCGLATSWRWRPREEIPGDASLTNWRSR